MRRNPVMSMQTDISASAILEALRAFADSAGNLAPIMVDREGAAQMYGMSVATYAKYEKRKLLPPMNAVGRVAVETLKRAALRLDGIADDGVESDPAERALTEWERKQ